MRERTKTRPLPLRLMAVFAAAVLLFASACRDDARPGENPAGASASEEDIAENAPGEGPDSGQADLLTGQEDLSEYGITYRVPDGWEQVPSLPSHMSLELDHPEVVHAVTRAEGTYVAFVSLTAVDARTSDGRTVSISEFAANMRTMLGLVGEGFHDGGQERYTVPRAEEAIRVDIAFGDVELDVTMLLVDTGADAFAVLSVGIDQGVRPTPDEVPDTVIDAVLTSVVAG